MQTVFTLNKLSMDFYTNYPATRYAEIEYKPSRPYVVMVVEIDGNKFALPLRTNIRHNNGGDEFTTRKYQFTTLRYFENELGI